MTSSAVRLPLFQPGADFQRILDEHGALPLARASTMTLQINVGKLCNMACQHCHVEAGPKRTEIMAERTVERVLELMGSATSIRTVDLTGGAPELNPHFRRMVRGARALGLEVIDRCNLSVLFEPGQQDLADFLADERVHVIASLPCYQQNNVDKQRGKGAFDKSVDALLRLNALGYGQPGSELRLDLVYNPTGAFLPPAQASLKASYQRELFENFGIRFHELLTITNMPISRFAHELRRSGQERAYMELLVNHFNPGTLSALMCRSTLSVGWDGRLYDCDFNQMLELDLGGRPRTLWDIDGFEELMGGGIATAPHCFGCTAGSGSSCGGTLSA